MRVVDASARRTVPFDVASDSVRLETSYLSMVPRRLNVVAEDGAWASAVPDKSNADSRSTPTLLFMAPSDLRGNRLCKTSSRVPGMAPEQRLDKDVSHNGLHED